MKISDANLKIIFDSRGNKTLEAELESGNFSVKASVPSGKSTSSHECFVLDPEQALGKFNRVKPEIISRGSKIDSQEEFDNFLISLDGTTDKRNLGGNLILSFSLAWARLKARDKGKELFEYIRQNSKFKIQNSKLPSPIFNVINGGAHAAHPQSHLDFQEFQIVPDVKDFGIALGLGREFYERLQEILGQKFGKENVVLGDEAGFSAPFKGNEEALDILKDLIVSQNYPLQIGLDIAASQFYKKGDTNGDKGYYFLNGKKYSEGGLAELYLNLIKNYNLVLLEDPFFEDDFDAFASLKRQIPAMIVTDDLTATNFERLKKAIKKESGSAILVKPNQIGTLTETLKVVELAYKNDWKVVVSHRSGETMDDFIADLAVAVGAWGIKAGAPAKPERLAKYERLLKIQELIVGNQNPK